MNLPEKNLAYFAIRHIAFRNGLGVAQKHILRSRAALSSRNLRAVRRTRVHHANASGSAVWPGEDFVPISGILGHDVCESNLNRRKRWFALR